MWFQAGQKTPVFLLPCQVPGGLAISTESVGLSLMSSGGLDSEAPRETWNTSEEGAPCPFVQTSPSLGPSAP